MFSTASFYDNPDDRLWVDIGIKPISHLKVYFE
ncbi:hypothetical protein TrispH2_005727 [Trichoplax sp. H2]|nr:hypothetical protein TrispH2_005727 [Trichoplax sp. H2]|eukprot:RDD42577.1 hypothetical protein TrispH2_005727 [Trichoplax sp. H2]